MPRTRTGGPCSGPVLPPTVTSTVPPTPTSFACATAAGAYTTTTNPLAFCFSSSASSTVPSPADPPPMLSPRSMSSAGGFVQASAWRTASSGSGLSTFSCSRTDHIAFASSSAAAFAWLTLPSATTITLAPISGTSA